MDWSEITKHHRAPYVVPRKYHDRVCMCAEPGPVLFGARRPGPKINCCATCRKPFRYYLQRCTNCREWFIKDFRKSEYGCARHTRCWECIKSTEPCECIKEVLTPSLANRDFDPLGLNPREVSQEERDAAFALDLKSPFD